MDLTKRIQNAVSALSKTNNSATLSGRSLARDFLANGSGTMGGNWKSIMLADKDMYRGYPYAMIDLRAKTVERIVDDVIRSTANQKTLDKLKKDGKEAIHPYLRAIRDSTNFTHDSFWTQSSKYIDMKGVRHIAFVRGKNGDVVGDPTEVFALNPYRVIEVVNQEDYEIGGYIETRDNGTQRLWEPYQIVRAVDEHPITEQPYGRIEAAKESQFTLKQAGDYTRSSLNANENAPGIISVSPGTGSGQVLLTPEQFKNFRESLRNHTKGTPIVTNGGTVSWQDMGIDLDKSALDKVNEIQRAELLAVMGGSRTNIGDEVSGGTKDTSEIQDNKLIRDQAIPTIRLIVSALNLDYRKNYPKDYEQYGWQILTEDPTSKNLAAEKDSIIIRNDELDLANKLINMGYDSALSVKYAKGEIDLDQLGEATPPKQETPTPEKEQENNTFNISPVINIPETKTPNVTVNAPDVNVEPSTVNITFDDIAEKIINTIKGDNNAVANNDLDDVHSEKILNQLDVADQDIVMQQQGSLTNGIVNIDSRIVSAVLNKVNKNQFETESDIIDEKDRNELQEELELILLGFYTVLFGLYGRSLMQKRSSEIGQLAEFKMNKQVTDYIRENAVKASESHVNTVLDELLTTIQKAHDEATELVYKALLDSGESASKALYAKAREMALDGAGRQQIISAIKATSNDISTKRATTIARNETRKAFTQTQFQADTQFLSENGWLEVAEKRWVTNSESPCGICLDQAARGWLPFTENFINKGEEITYTAELKDGTPTTRTVKMDYEDIDAGLAHVNCQCSYELRVTQEEA